MSTKFAFLFSSISLVVYAQGTSNITATPAKLSFSYQIGAALPATQTVALKVVTGTPAASTFTVAVPAGIQWVIVTPTAGKLPASLTVRVNPINSPGVYNTEVDVTVAGVVTPIPITVVVSEPLPTLTINPTTVNLSGSTSPVSGTVTLSTTGALVTFTASVAGATWLTLPLNSTSGVVPPGGLVTLAFTADPTGLTPQAKAFTGKITVVANSANKTQNIAVNFTVNSSVPTITSLWPNPVQANTGAVTLWINGTNFYSGTTVKAGSTPLTPLLISSTQLQVVVPANMLTIPGTSVSITVTNPLGGGVSAPAALIVASSPLIQAVVNAASYTAGNLSPGELVALFGQGIGPATPVFMNVTGGYVDTSAGGLTVTIGSAMNGFQAAPLLYADPNQITIQVPYNVSLGAGQTVQVSNGTVTSTLFPAGTTITIGATAPGIFTADGTGIGQAAAEVYDGTTGAYMGLNSTTNPAHAADTVVLYLTGEGGYVPPPGSHTGYIIPPPVPPATLPPQMPPAQAPTVTIGGISATVTYAGAVQGSILGLLQVNAVVPAGVAPGNALVVASFPSGSTMTQDKVTLAVK